VAPPSSRISTRPGFSCSMEGTWLARTPISPEAAGMLTWVLWSQKIRQYSGRDRGGCAGWRNAHAGRAVDGLSKRCKVSLQFRGRRSVRGGSTYLVRKGQGQLNLVGNGLGVSTALDRSAEHGGTGPEGRASEAEGVHLAMIGGWNGWRDPS
jgi:hypothetical protein